jgi:3-oxoacyl-[acyl-carrier-protein] synthase-3
MALFVAPGVQIAGIAAAVPASRVSNQQLDLFDDGEKQDFIAKIGIDSRRIAPPGLCSSDLCAAAAGRLLQEAGVDAGSVGVLVFVTQTPDYLLPGNSMVVQQTLGISSGALLLDLNQGCAGYLYGLSVIFSVMRTCAIDYGLLLVGDTITRLVSPLDRATLPIFSDAGSATLLKRAESGRASYFNLEADGRGCHAICVEGGGGRHPFGMESLLIREESPGVSRAAIHLGMNGIDVLNYSLKNVAPNIRALLDYAHCDQEAVDYFIFHQANRILNESIVKKCGIPREKVPETLSEFGNTSSATIPLTLSFRLGPTLWREPKKLLLSGFGVGFSWGSALIDTEKLICPPLLEINCPPYGIQ